MENLFTVTQLLNTLSVLRTGDEVEYVFLVKINLKPGFTILIIHSTKFVLGFLWLVFTFQTI